MKNNHIIENVYVPAVQEVDEYPDITPDAISDFDVNGQNQDMIEWDGVYGRYWSTYETREEYEAAIEKNKKEWENFKAAYGKPYEWLKKYLIV